MPSIQNEIMEEFRDKFKSSNVEQTHNAYPFKIYPAAHESLEEFITESIHRVLTAAKEAVPEEIHNSKSASYDLGYQDGFNNCSFKATQNLEALNQEV